MGERPLHESAAGEARRSAPAALRNREPIADVLEDWLPASGTVLEIASGSGEHAVHFAGRFPALCWQPSDVDEGALASILAWREESGLANLLPPIQIDSAAQDWPVKRADAILSINMVHISPWASALGLLEGCRRLLGKGSPLIVYGPWLADDVATSPSNMAFDADLKSRDPRWGLRRLEEFAAAAADRGLNLVERRAMPANNMMMLFHRDGRAVKASFTTFR